jgi:hypothetical protein
VKALAVSNLSLKDSTVQIALSRTHEELQQHSTPEDIREAMAIQLSYNKLK